MLLNCFNWMAKWFWGSDNVCAIYSLYSATLDGGGDSKIDGVVSAITTTSDDVISSCETGVWCFESDKVGKHGQSWEGYGKSETGKLIIEICRRR